MDKIINLENDSLYFVQSDVTALKHHTEIYGSTCLSGSDIVKMITDHVVVDGLYDYFYTIIGVSKIARGEKFSGFKQLIACDKLGAIIGSVDYYCNIANKLTSRNDPICFKRFDALVYHCCTYQSIYGMIKRYHDNRLFFGGYTTYIVDAIVKVVDLYNNNMIDDRFNNVCENFVDCIADVAVIDNAVGFVNQLREYPSAYRFVVNRNRQFAEIR